MAASWNTTVSCHNKTNCKRNHAKSRQETGRTGVCHNVCTLADLYSQNRGLTGTLVKQKLNKWTLYAYIRNLELNQANMTLNYFLFLFLQDWGRQISFFNKNTKTSGDSAGQKLFRIYFHILMPHQLSNETTLAGDCIPPPQIFIHLHVRSERIWNEDKMTSNHGVTHVSSKGAWNQEIPCKVKL